MILLQRFALACQTLPEHATGDAHDRNVLAFIFVWAVALSTAGHGQMLRCIEESPERRGEPGCSVVVEKRLPAPPTQPLMWHIDEFTSLAAAEKASGPSGVAFEAHGSA